MPMQEERALKELMTEHDQLRKEILQNDTLEVQILVGTLALTAAAISFASSEVITNALMKVGLFFAGGGIATIGLWQTIDLCRGTFLIAAYLRIFIEPKTQHLRWETRLYKFRQYSFSLGHGPFEKYRLFT